MNDTLDRLQCATLRLSQEGTIKDRLADAYTTHLRDIDVEHLPENLRGPFDQLRSAMHREVPQQPRESAVRASVRKMSNLEARHLAELVVRLFAAAPKASDANVSQARL
jgi:hypothetical protein